MKRFRFTLDAVRIVRQRAEQEAMDQYGRTLLARQQAMEQLAAVQQRLSAGFGELRELLNQGCAAAAATQVLAYHRTLEKRREECEGALSVAERRVNAAFNTMITARQQREIVDKSFQKQKASHQREVARDEQKFLDDLGSRRTASVLSWSASEAMP